MGNDWTTEELAAVLRSRSWEVSGLREGVRGAFLSVLRQCGSPSEEAFTTLKKLESFLRDICSHLLEDQQHESFEDLFDGSFLILVSERELNTEFARQLRTKGKSFIKINKTDGELALLGVIVRLIQSRDGFKDNTPLEPTLIKAFNCYDEIRAILKISGPDDNTEERLEKLLRNHLKWSLADGKYPIYIYDPKQGKADRKGRKPVLLVPSPPSKSKSRSRVLSSSHK